MGGRGARFGVSKSGKKYGDEHYTIYHSGSIKFIKGHQNDTKIPLETMTKGRIYASVNGNDEVHAIGFYSPNLKRFKQIDLIGRPHNVNGDYILPHTHFGYTHSEGGTYKLSDRERKIVANILKVWDNRDK